MSKYYEQLQNNSSENSSRRISRRQEVTELDLFAFAAARKAREKKADEPEAAAPSAPPPPEEQVAPPPPPPPPPPAPLEPPRKMVSPRKEPEPSYAIPDYQEDEPAPAAPSRLPVSPRRFAEIVFVGLSVILIVLALQKLLRREPATEKPDEDVAAVNAEMIPDPDVVVAEPTPTSPRATPATPVPAEDPTPMLAVPGTVARMDGDITAIRFTSGIFSRNDELSPAAKQTLSLLAREIKPLLADNTLKIVGYTDNETVKKNRLYKDNVELGLLRARAVERFLRSQLGVAAGAFQVESAGSRGAPYPNDTLENRKRNRTVVLQLIPQPAAP